MNTSTEASLRENSLLANLDMENPNNFTNPLVKMPVGHTNYSEADKNLCPVMSGKIKAPEPEPDQEGEEDDSDSSDEEEETEVEMPDGHRAYSDKDKENCPVMSGKIPNPQTGTAQQDQQKKKKKKKKVQSGCPFMPTESKKPPALAHLEPAFDIPYLSTLRHLFTFGGILPKNKSNPEKSRVNFNSYPVFLKHTLFHDDQQFAKVRKLEVAHRFFIYDKFREQGNKRYNKNRHQEALGLYEHALSCFKWLELKKEEKKVEDEETKENDPYANIKPMNKALGTVFSDENVILRDGEEITDPNEIDMRNSMLVNIYLALACAYLKLGHFNAAIVAIDEGTKICTNSSQLYFRRSQARAYNKGSSLEDLYKAKEDIEKAIEIKHTEKIFQQEPGILKILNVDNAGEIYVEHAHLVENLIKNRREEIKETLRGFFAKVREYEYVEELMLKDGNVAPEQTEEEHAVEIKDEENMEYDLIKEMINKYLRIIEFNLETDKKDQIAIAKKEIQNVYEVYYKMTHYLSLNFKKVESDSVMSEVLQEFEIDLTKPKNQKRLDRLRNNRAKEIFENGHFNLEVFQYALKDIFKKKEEEKKKQQEREKQYKDIAKPKGNLIKQFLGMEIGVQLAIMIAVFGIFWYWNKGGFISLTAGFANSK